MNLDEFLKFWQELQNAYKEEYNEELSSADDILAEYGERKRSPLTRENNNIIVLLRNMNAPFEIYQRVDDLLLEKGMVYYVDDEECLGISYINEVLDKVYNEWDDRILKNDGEKARAQYTSNALHRKVNVTFEKNKIKQKEEEERKRKEEEERQRKEEEERQRKAEEERQRKAEEERQRKAEEERQRKAEEERQRKAEEERKKQAEEERQRKAEEERQRKAEEERQRKAEEERQRKAEEERKKQAEEERQRKAEEERQRKAEEERQRKAEEERQRKAEEERQREAEEERQRLKIEREEARKRREAEKEEERKKQEAAEKEEERLNKEKAEKEHQDEKFNMKVEERLAKEITADDLKNRKNDLNERLEEELKEATGFDKKLIEEISNQLDLVEFNYGNLLQYDLEQIDNLCQVISAGHAPVTTYDDDKLNLKANQVFDFLQEVLDTGAYKNKRLSKVYEEFTKKRAESLDEKTINTIKEEIAKEESIEKKVVEKKVPEKRDNIKIDVFHGKKFDLGVDDPELISEFEKLEAEKPKEKKQEEEKQEEEKSVLENNEIEPAQRNTSINETRKGMLKKLKDKVKQAGALVKAKNDQQPKAEKKADENVNEQPKEEKKADENVKEDPKEEKKADENVNEPLKEEKKADENVNEPLKEEKKADENVNEPLKEEKKADENVNEPLKEEKKTDENVNEPLKEEKKADENVKEDPKEEKKADENVNEPLKEKEKVDDNVIDHSEKKEVIDDNEIEQPEVKENVGEDVFQRLGEEQFYADQVIKVQDDLKAAGGKDIAKALKDALENFAAISGRSLGWNMKGDNAETFRSIRDAADALNNPIYPGTSEEKRGALYRACDKYLRAHTADGKTIDGQNTKVGRLRKQAVVAMLQALEEYPDIQTIKNEMDMEALRAPANSRKQPTRVKLNYKELEKSLADASKSSLKLSREQKSNPRAIKTKAYSELVEEREKAEFNRRR